MTGVTDRMEEPLYSECAHNGGRLGRWSEQNLDGSCDGNHLSKEISPFSMEYWQARMFPAKNSHIILQSDHNFLTGKGADDH